MNYIDQIDILSEYQLEYQAFAQQKNKSHDPKQKIIINKESEVLFFPSINPMQNNQIFVIVPSIFNSPDILAIGEPDDLITNLCKHGAVYLIKWQIVEDKNFNLSSYAKVTSQIIQHIASITQNSSVHVVGHCLGGIFALAASIMLQNLVHSMILLTCPWDFSYLASKKTLLELMQIDNALIAYKHVPAIYLQILFFLLHPSSFEQKLEFFAVNHDAKSRALFFEIESWQFSGNAITKATYHELMRDFIGKNILLKNRWIVDRTLIDPSKFLKPVMLISGIKDKVVPKASNIELRNLLPNAISVEYDTGHIGYLIGSQRRKFISDIHNWLNHMLLVKAS